MARVTTVTFRGERIPMTPNAIASSPVKRGKSRDRRMARPRTDPADEVDQDGKANQNPGGLAEGLVEESKDRCLVARSDQHAGGRNDDYEIAKPREEDTACDDRREHSRERRPARGRAGEGHEDGDQADLERHGRIDPEGPGQAIARSVGLDGPFAVLGGVCRRVHCEQTENAIKAPRARATHRAAGAITLTAPEPGTRTWGRLPAWPLLCTPAYPSRCRRGRVGVNELPRSSVRGRRACRNVCRLSTRHRRRPFSRLLAG